MIRSFGSRALKRFFKRGKEHRIHASHRETVRDILARQDAAATPEDLNLPGFRLHPLTGDRADCRAVTVRASRRITFRFEDGDAFDLDYLDYH